MDQTTAERHNQVRFARGNGALVESLFCKMHLPDGEALWLRYTLRRSGPGDEPVVGGLWALLSGPDGHVGGCDTFGADAIAVAGKRFWVRVGPGEMSMGRATGQIDHLVTGDGTAVSGTLSWNLVFQTGTPCLVHFPNDLMYSGPFPRNKIASPHVSTRFFGTVVVAGRQIYVRSAPGMQGHNWGTGVSGDWVWAHANVFSDDREAVFEAISSRITVGPMTMPPLSVAYLRLGGREYLLNGPKAMASARSTTGPMSWHLSAAGAGIRLEASLDAPPERTIALGYVSSDGGLVPCQNSNLANARIHIDGLPGGPLDLIANRTATLEMGGRAATAVLPEMFRG